MWSLLGYTQDMHSREWSEQHVLRAKWCCLYFDFVFSFVKLTVISTHGGSGKIRKMLKLSPSDRFQFSKPLDWPDWKLNYFLRFRLATKLHKEDGTVQDSALIYTMGREAEHVYKSFTLAEGDNMKFDVILAKFDGHFLPKRNTIHEWARFYQRNQKQGESVESFLRIGGTFWDNSWSADRR